MKSRKLIRQICGKKNQLANDELIFIFDFLLEMCKNAQTNEQHAISIGTHLINDFYEKSNQQFDKSIFDNRLQTTSELLALNFEMRSKKFIEEVNAQNSSMS